MNSKNKLWLILGAAIVVVLAVFLIVRTTGNGTNTGDEDYREGYEPMAVGSLVDVVGEDIYNVTMNMVEFIKSEKFVNADFEAHSGDTQLALGDDYEVLARFDEVYSEHVINSSSDVSSAESDIQYLLQTLGSGLSAQIQQKALMIQVNEIEAEPAKWTHLDMSQMPEVIAIYASLAQDAVKTIESENMKQIRDFFDGQPWNNKLKPYGDYLATFSEGLAIYE